MKALDMWRGIMIAVFLVVVDPGEAVSNGPMVGRDAGSVFPIASEAVRLVSENVVVRLPENGPGHVECIYQIRNESDQLVSFEMAFVTETPSADPGRVTELYRDAGFEVWLGKESLPFSMEALDKARWADILDVVPDSLPVWRVTLPASTTGTLLMNYGVLWSGGADGQHVFREFTYHARAAALWAGTIEEAYVGFNFGGIAGPLLQCVPEDNGCFEMRIVPSGYEKHSSGLRWRYTDWEPDCDFSVAFSWFD